MMCLNVFEHTVITGKSHVKAIILDGLILKIIHMIDFDTDLPVLQPCWVSPSAKNY